MKNLKMHKLGIWTYLSKMPILFGDSIYLAVVEFGLLIAF